MIRPKINCEIKGCGADRKTLEYHHIHERHKPGTNNHNMNISILCPTHHKLLDYGTLKIIGVYPSTNISGFTLVYELNGESNFPGITEAYFTAKSPSKKV